MHEHRQSPCNFAPCRPHEPTTKDKLRFMIPPTENRESRPQIYEGVKMMQQNEDLELDLLRISIPGPITVEILGTESLEFDAPVLQLSGGQSLTPEQVNILQVMVQLISHMGSE